MDAKSIRDFVASIGIVDVHEHHMPEILLNPEVNLLQLFQQSYAGWTQSRPYTLPTERRESDPMLVATGPTTWEALEPFLEKSGSNSFVRNLVCAITELHGAGEKAITRDNWEAVDAAVRQQHQREDWCRDVLRRARIEQRIGVRVGNQTVHFSAAQNVSAPVRACMLLANFAIKCLPILARDRRFSIPVKLYNCAHQIAHE